MSSQYIKPTDPIKLQFWQARENRRARKASKPGHVYVLEGEGGYFKIGMTTCYSSPLERVKAFSTLPWKVTLLFSVLVVRVRETEQMMHKLYAHKRVIGEWFKLTDSDLAAIRAKLEKRAFGEIRAK